MDFSLLHIYQSDSCAHLNAGRVAVEIKKRIPGIRIDIRNQFDKYWGAGQLDELHSSARIADLKQPFEKQPAVETYTLPLYDGFVLRRLLSSLISDEESDSNHVHVVITDKLICTFDEDDWRYHARTVICGTPTIISSTGIVEAPSKPKEYYQLSRPGLMDPQELKKRFVGRFLDDGDSRLQSALVLYLYQAVFFFITEGDPFCKDKRCQLYNSHWQEELINNLAYPVFCNRHEKMLEKFNAERQRCNSRSGPL